MFCHALTVEYSHSYSPSEELGDAVMSPLFNRVSAVCPVIHIFGTLRMPETVAAVFGTSLTPLHNANTSLTSVSQAVQTVENPMQLGSIEKQEETLFASTLVPTTTATTTATFTPPAVPSHFATVRDASTVPPVLPSPAPQKPSHPEATSCSSAFPAPQSAPALTCPAQADQRQNQYTACVHVHGVYPYFLAPQYDASVSAAQFGAQLETVALRTVFGDTSSGSYDSSTTVRREAGGGGTGGSSVGARFAYGGVYGQRSKPPAPVHRQLLHNVELVDRVPFYGYHAHAHSFYKVSVIDPGHVQCIMELLQETEEVGGTRWQLYGASGKFHLQFMIDHGISGAAPFTIFSCSMRAPLPFCFTATGNGNSNNNTTSSSTWRKSHSGPALQRQAREKYQMRWLTQLGVTRVYPPDELERLTRAQVELDVSGDSLLHGLKYGALSSSSSSSLTSAPLPAFSEPGANMMHIRRLLKQYFADNGVPDALRVADDIATEEAEALKTRTPTTTTTTDTCKEGADTSASTAAAASGRYGMVAQIQRNDASALAMRAQMCCFLEQRRATNKRCPTGVASCSSDEEVRKVEGERKGAASATVVKQNRSWTAEATVKQEPAFLLATPRYIGITSEEAKLGTQEEGALRMAGIEIKSETAANVLKHSIQAGKVEEKPDMKFTPREQSEGAGEEEEEGGPLTYELLEAFGRPYDATSVRHTDEITGSAEKLPHLSDVSSVLPNQRGTLCNETEVKGKKKDDDEQHEEGDEEAQLLSLNDSLSVQTQEQEERRGQEQDQARARRGGECFAIVANLLPEDTPPLPHDPVLVSSSSSTSSAPPATVVVCAACVTEKTDGSVHTAGAATSSFVRMRWLLPLSESTFAASEALLVKREAWAPSSSGGMDTPQASGVFASGEMLLSNVEDVWPAPLFIHVEGLQVSVAPKRSNTRARRQWESDDDAEAVGSNSEAGTNMALYNLRVVPLRVCFSLTEYTSAIATHSVASTWAVTVLCRYTYDVDRQLLTQLQARDVAAIRGFVRRGSITMAPSAADSLCQRFGRKSMTEGIQTPQQGIVDGEGSDGECVSFLSQRGLFLSCPEALDARLDEVPEDEDLVLLSSASSDLLEGSSGSTSDEDGDDAMDDTVGKPSLRIEALDVVEAALQVLALEGMRRSVGARHRECVASQQLIEQRRVRNSTAGGDDAIAVESSSDDVQGTAQARGSHLAMTISSADSAPPSPPCFSSPPSAVSVSTNSSCALPNQEGGEKEEKDGCVEVLTASVATCTSSLHVGEPAVAVSEAPLPRCGGGGAAATSMLEYITSGGDDSPKRCRCLLQESGACGGDVDGISRRFLCEAKRCGRDERSTVPCGCGPSCSSSRDGKPIMHISGVTWPLVGDLAADRRSRSCPVSATAPLRAGACSIEPSQCDRESKKKDKAAKATIATTGGGKRILQQQQQQQRVSGASPSLPIYTSIGAAVATTDVRLPPPPPKAAAAQNIEKVKSQHHVVTRNTAAAASSSTAPSLKRSVAVSATSTMVQQQYGQCTLRILCVEVLVRRHEGSTHLASGEIMAVGLGQAHSDSEKMGVHLFCVCRTSGSRKAAEVKMQRSFRLSEHVPVMVLHSEAALLHRVRAEVLSYDPDLLLSWDGYKYGLGLLAVRYRAVLGRRLDRDLSRLYPLHRHQQQQQRRSWHEKREDAADVATATGAAPSLSKGTQSWTDARQLLENDMDDDEEDDEVDGAEAIPEGATTAQQYARRFGAALRVQGRLCSSLGKELRKELKAPSYSLPMVYSQLFKRSLPYFSDACLCEMYEGGEAQLLLQLSSPAQQPWDMKGAVGELYAVLTYLAGRVAAPHRIACFLNQYTRILEFSRMYGILYEEVIGRGSQFKVEATLHRMTQPAGFAMLSPTRQQVFRQPRITCVPLIMQPRPGFYHKPDDPIVVLDFRSLYPSVIMAYNLCYSTCLGLVRPESSGRLGVLSNYTQDDALLADLVPDGKRSAGGADEMGGATDVNDDCVTFTPNGAMFLRPSVREGILPRMVRLILDTRFEVQKAIKHIAKGDSSEDGGDPYMCQRLAEQQLALKLLANVTYGYTAASFTGRMPCVDVAEAIVSLGRQTLERAIALIKGTREWRADVVYGDTDSIFVRLPGRTRQEAFAIGQAMANAVTAANPVPVRLQFEKVLHPCVLLVKKRYVGYAWYSLQQQEGELLAKGIETVRRDQCAATSKVLDGMLRRLLSGSTRAELKAFYYAQVSKLQRGDGNPSDCIFRRAVRLGRYGDEAHLPAGAHLALQLMTKDVAQTPYWGERLPYVVVVRHTAKVGARGGGETMLRDHIVHPTQLLYLHRAMEEEEGSNTAGDVGEMVLDTDYYIHKHINAALGRVFYLVGISVAKWFNEMPRGRTLRSFLGARTLVDTVKLTRLLEARRFASEGEERTEGQLMRRHTVGVCLFPPCKRPREGEQKQQEHFPSVPRGLHTQAQRNMLDSNPPHDAAVILVDDSPARPSSVASPARVPPQPVIFTKATRRERRAEELNVKGQGHHGATITTTHNKGLRTTLDAYFFRDLCAVCRRNVVSHDDGHRLFCGQQTGSTAVVCGVRQDPGIVLVSEEEEEMVHLVSDLRASTVDSGIISEAQDDASPSRSCGAVEGTAAAAAAAPLVPPPICAECQRDPQALLTRVTDRCKRAAENLRRAQRACQLCIGSAGVAGGAAWLAGETGVSDIEDVPPHVTVPLHLTGAVLPPHASAVVGEERDDDDSSNNIICALDGVMASRHGCISIDCEVGFSKKRLTMMHRELMVLQRYLQVALMGPPRHPSDDFL